MEDNLYGLSTMLPVSHEGNCDIFTLDANKGIWIRHAGCSPEEYSEALLLDLNVLLPFIQAFDEACSNKQKFKQTAVFTAVRRFLVDGLECFEIVEAKLSGTKKPWLDGEVIYIDYKNSRGFGLVDDDRYAVITIADHYQLLTQTTDVVERAS